MSWAVHLLELCKRYGKAAKFASSSILGAILPGSSAVLALVEQAFDSAEEAADKQWELRVDKQLEASAADLERLGQLFGILQGDLNHVTAQVARLERMPEVASQLIETALVSDVRCQEAARHLEGLAGRFERLEQQQQKLLAGQEEMLPLLRRAVGVCDYVEELRSAGFSAEAFGEMLRAFQTALRLLGEGKLVEAESKLLGMSAERPLNVSATLALAAVQTASRDFLQAEQTLSRAQRLRPEDLELVLLHSRVTTLSRRGKTPARANAPASPGRRQPKEGDALDGWQLERLLGHGGWGLVFRATRNERAMALKVMHPELSADSRFVERFKREIITLARLGKHPHLVEIDSFGYSSEHACWYFVMEWIEGITLEQYLAKSGALPWPTARALFTQLAEGLSTAHARGIVHRDIKPGNIMLASDGRPVLVDFGLALEAESGLTRTGHSAGYTALFAAPEQIRKNQADTRSDVYSLAASLYYTISYDDPARREPHCFKARFVPEAARELLTQALDNDPSERPADAAAFRDALRQAQETLVVDAGGQGDARSISEALRLAAPGAEVRIRPGRYVESVVLDRPVKLRGDGTREDIILANPRGPCLVMQTGEAHVSGLTLVGQGEGSGAALTVHVSQGHLHLSDCDIQGGRGVGIPSGGMLTMLRSRVRDSLGTGLLFEGGDGLVEECEVLGSQLVGVQMTQGSKPTLRRCSIHHGRQGGMLFGHTGGGLIEECDIFANSLSGVDCKRGGDPVLKRCRFHDNRTNGVYVYENGRGTLEDCEIFANHLQGIAVKHGGYLRLHRCRIHDNRECGVFLYEKGSGALEGCDIFGNGMANVEIKDGADPRLNRCRVRDGKVCGILLWVGGTARIEDCEISGNAYAGVEIKQAAEPTFVGCRITNNGGSAFYVHEQGTGTVEGCELKGNRLGAWDIGTGCRLRRQGNVE